jgi:hypothetical protein
MGWLSAIKKAVKAPVRLGLAPVKLTAKMARPLQSQLRAGVRAGLMPVRMAAATTKLAARATAATARTASRVSPHAIVARKLMAAANRAPTTPFQQGGSSSGWGGGGGGDAAEGDEEEEETYAPEDTGADDGGGGEDEEGISGIDYRAYLDDGRQLAGFTDDLERIGVNLAKGAASGILTSAAGALSSRPTVAAPPPKPAGMSTTAKLAIGAGVLIPVLFVLTRKRSSAPVAV